jgi:hypothetical protein
MVTSGREMTGNRTHWRGRVVEVPIHELLASTMGGVSREIGA